MLWGSAVKVPTFVKVEATKSFLKELANSANHKTTFVGVVGAALLASDVDWGRLFNGDHGEAGKLAGVVTVALLGYFTNRKA